MSKYDSTLASFRGVENSVSGNSKEDAAAITQQMSTTTAVTLNSTHGRVTMFAGSQAASTATSFTVNNSTVQADSVVVLTAFGATAVLGHGVVATVGAVAAGSFVVTLNNFDVANAVTAVAPVIHFKVF